MKSDSLAHRSPSLIVREVQSGRAEQIAQSLRHFSEKRKHGASGVFDPSILPLLLAWGSSGKEVRQYQTDYDHPDEITSRGEVAHHHTASRCEKKHGKDNAR